MNAVFPAREAAPEAVPVRVFNVRFSPNLGDGLLSDCLEAALRHCGMGAESFDLAARTTYARDEGGREARLRLLRALPRGLRQSLASGAMQRRAEQSWRPHYRQALAGAEAVVIGGGNLLSDLDLNFPTKLLTLMEEIASRDLPVVLYGVGLSRGWSARGAQMLRQAFALPQLKAVFLRDAASCAAWDELLAPTSRLKARAVRDPGLLAARFFCADTAITAPRTRIGIGLTSPLAVAYHGAERQQFRHLSRWYAALVTDLLARGWPLTLFTNGAPEDRHFLARFVESLPKPADSAALEIAEAETPAELVALVRRCRVVIAHRMHALIPAFSCGVPAIALSREAKVRSLVATLEGAMVAFDAGRETARACADLAERLAAAPLDPALPQRVQDAALADIAALAERLRALMAPAAAPFRETVAPAADAPRAPAAAPVAAQHSKVQPA